MAEEQEVQTSTPEQTEAAPSPSDDFDKALAEFTETNGEDRASPPSDGDGAAKPKTPDELREEYSLRHELNRVRTWASEVDQERFEQRESDETAAVLERGSAMIAEFPVPDHFAERFLRSEYLINPALQEAWNARHDSPEAQRRCEREVEKALGRLYEAAKTTPDPGLTAEHEAVAFAVRNASKRVPEGKPPNYANMTDQELRETVEKEFGFTPGI